MKIRRKLIGPYAGENACATVVGQAFSLPGLLAGLMLAAALAPTGVAGAPAGGELLVGWASADITPDRPVALAGQMHTRISKSVHDPVTATVLALESKGTAEQAILVSCDLVSIDAALDEALRRQIRERLKGFDSARLILNATHTHTAPVVMDGRYEIPKEAMQPFEYRAFLVDRLATAVTQAWRSRKPGGVSWALGQAVVGHNRRAVYEDGSARMYGKTGQADFRRLEGGEDHGVELLFLWDFENRLTGIAINLACPSQVVEGQSYISADFWNDVRKLIKARYPENPFVFPMTGASGDQSPHIQFRRRAEERLWERLGISQTEEIARRIVNAVDYVLPAAKTDIRRSAPFVHKVEDLRLPPRKITAAEAELARLEYERLAKLPADDRSRHVQLNRSKEVMDRYARQDRQPPYEMKLHVIRLGDIAIATNPFELFVDYGIQIKARSLAEQTFVVQLSGAGTYLPTARAIAGGHYSAGAADNRVGPEGGQVLVERTAEAINSLWK